MITDKTYQEQMKRLEGAINQKIYEGSFKVWKKELEDNRFTDKDFIAGITHVVDSLRNGEIKTYDIHIGTLLKFCGKGREHNLTPEERGKIEEARYRHLSQDAILSRGMTPFAKILCANLYKYLNGEITRKTFLLKHKDLIQRELGKYPAVIDRDLKKEEKREVK